MCLYVVCFFDLHQGTHQLILGVPLRKVSEQHPQATHQSIIGVQLRKVNEQRLYILMELDISNEIQRELSKKQTKT
jgi:hypothetical protein